MCRTKGSANKTYTFKKKKRARDYYPVQCELDGYCWYLLEKWCRDNHTKKKDVIQAAILNYIGAEK